MTSEEKRLVLNGSSDFVGWYKITEAYILQKKWKTISINFSNKENFNTENNIDVYAYLMSTLSKNIASQVPTAGYDPEKLMAFLKENYGCTNQYHAKTLYEDIKMKNIDPNIYIMELRQAEELVIISGAKIQPDHKFTKILEGLNQDFYGPWIRDTRMKYSEIEKSEQIINSMFKGMKSFFDSSTKEQKEGFVTSTALATGISERYCTYCAENHPKTAATHDTKYCRMNNNKGSKNYFFDTCASEHFTSNQANLNNFRKVDGKVVATANGSHSRIIGIGQETVGNINLKNINYAPDMNFNLISASKLAENGFKVIIWKQKGEPDLKIYQDANKTPLATGYFTQNGLLQLNSPVTVLLTQKEHANFGHLGKTEDPCSTCMNSKRRKRNVPRKSKSNYKILEKVDVDIQGPFSISNIDGTKYNIKCVDKNSKYVKTELLLTKSSASTADFIKRFHTRSERQTGSKLKIIGTDSGTEFNGEFLSYLETNGIIKHKGQPYDHHSPSCAENAHRTINGMARAMLSSSLLPENYYGEAILTATYLINRWSKEGKSRYEKFFNRIPKVDHLHPFGVVCYAFIPPEKRGKISETRVKCRLLGYADDDDTEEMFGYKVVIEEDEKIIFCNDVTFTTIFEKLPQKESFNPDWHNVFRIDNLPNDNFQEFVSSEEGTSGDTIIVPSSANHPSESSYTPSEIPSSTLSSSDEVYSDEGEFEGFIDEMQTRSWWNEPDIESTALLVHALSTTKESVPKTLKEALNSNNKEEWIKAMELEMESLIDMGVFINIQSEKPKNVKTIKSRWVFTQKFDFLGFLEKYKARLVAKGYLEKQIGEENNFSPTASSPSMRILIAKAAQNKWTVFQDDQKSAFLNADIQGKWIELPNGKYIHIRKALYGLRESPRKWFLTYRKFMLKEGFKQSKSEPCLFFKHNCIVSLHVDDTLSAGEKSVVKDFRCKLRKEFKSGKGGIAKHYLGINIEQDQNEITLNQSVYIKEKLETYKKFLGTNPNLKVNSPLIPNFQAKLLEAENSEDTWKEFPYLEMIGSLIYLSTMTRLDISASVSIVSRFSSAPKKIHCEMIQRIYWYLRKTINLCLSFKRGLNTGVECYCDASWGNLEDYKSLSGYLITFNGTPIIWKSHRQTSTAKSTQESEYMALTPALQDVLWLRSIMDEMQMPLPCTKIFEDNDACIVLANNPQSTVKTRHIQIKYHWIREHLETKEVCLVPINTSMQKADILTKGFYGPAIQSYYKSLNLKFL